MTSMQHGMLWSPFNARCMLLRSLADFRSLLNFQYTTQKITGYTGKPSIIFPVIFYVSSLLNEMFSVSLLFLGVMDVHIAQVYFRSASGSWRGFSATQATEVSLLQFERDARQPPRADRDKTEPCRSQYNTVSRRMTHRFDLDHPTSRMQMYHVHPSIISSAAAGRGSGYGYLLCMSQLCQGTRGLHTTRRCKSARAQGSNRSSWPSQLPRFSALICLSAA